MTATIRLYRRFYKITSADGVATNELITPSEIVSTKVYIKDTSTLIETVTNVTAESTGVYYVDLNPNLYSYDCTYDLKWTVKYLSNTSNKILVTSFRLQPINLANGIDTEIQSQIIEVIII